MTDLDGLLLLRPGWLLSVPLLLVAGGWLAWRRRGLGAWGRLIGRELLPVLTALGHVLPPQSRTGLLLPGLVALIVALALAGPALPNRQAPSFDNLDGVMILLDLSPSVSLGGSLDDAQAAVAELLQNLGGRPVGLILFAGEPYLVSALTVDAASLQSPVAVLGADTMPDRGSRPDRALQLAATVLADAGTIGGDVVLVSDGGGEPAEMLRAARRIGASGARLSTVFVEPVARPPGMPVADAELLARLAAAGDGLAVEAGGLRPLLDLLARPRRQALAQSELAPLLFTDLGRWMLLLALPPALLLLRRRA